MDYDAVMHGDPKNPNAWWAVKPPRLAEILPMDFGKAPKRRLIWLIPIVVLILSIEIFFLLKIMLHS
jgi:hypothetical protein